MHFTVPLKSHLNATTKAIVDEVFLLDLEKVNAFKRKVYLFNYKNLLFF